MTGPCTARLRELLGIEFPVVLAGMAGGPTTPELVAAVSAAGGLGTFGLQGMTAEAAGAAVRRARELTDRPIAVNVLLAPPIAPDAGAIDPDRGLDAARRDLGLGPPSPPAVSPSPARDLIAAGLEAGAGIVSVGLGDPSAVADLARAAGAPLIAMAATVDDARAATGSGADAIVAQGADAGGHRSDFHVPPDGVVPLVGTLSLVPQICDAVDVPVIAAGGIADARGAAAALALGAEGVQMGTTFLMAIESGVPSAYRARLAATREVDTRVTRAVSGRPARAIVNRLVEDLEGLGPPGRGWPAQMGASADVRVAAAAAGRDDLLALWAGQAAGLAGPPRPAAEIVAEVVAGVASRLSAISG